MRDLWKQLKQSLSHRPVYSLLCLYGWEKENERSLVRSCKFSKPAYSPSCVHTFHLLWQYPCILDVWWLLAFQSMAKRNYSYISWGWWDQKLSYYMGALDQKLGTLVCVQGWAMISIQPPCHPCPCSCKGARLKEMYCHWCGTLPLSTLWPQWGSSKVVWSTHVIPNCVEVWLALLVCLLLCKFQVCMQGSKQIKEPSVKCWKR